MGDKPTNRRERNIDDGPFGWFSKAALKRIRDAFDGQTYLDQAVAVYTAHCELASDAQSPTYTSTRRNISGRSGVSIRRVAEINSRLQNIGLLDWKQNHIEGTKELGPSTFSLLTASTTPSTASTTPSTASTTPSTASTRSGKNGKSDFCTVRKESEESKESETKHEREQSAGPAMQRASGSGSTERPSRREVEAYAETIGLGLWKTKDWFDEMEGCGWKDFQHRDIVNWQAVLRRVKTKWEADGRPDGPPAAKQRPAPHASNGGAIAPRSINDLRMVIEAKEREAKAIRDKHCSATATGNAWDSQPMRQEYIKLRNEIKKLNRQVANAA